jgi:hypothetical protein
MGVPFVVDGTGDARGFAVSGAVSAVRSSRFANAVARDQPLRGAYPRPLRPSPPRLHGLTGTHWDTATSQRIDFASEPRQFSRLSRNRRLSWLCGGWGYGHGARRGPGGARAHSVTGRPPRRCLARYRRRGGTPFGQGHCGALASRSRITLVANLARPNPSLPPSGSASCDHRLRPETTKRFRYAATDTTAKRRQCAAVRQRPGLYEAINAARRTNKCFVVSGRSQSSQEAEPAGVGRGSGARDWRPV